MNILDAQILRVDLTREEISFESAKPYVSRFLGGRGISEYLLFKECPIGGSPFDPDIPIIFGSGLFAGTPVPGATRIDIESRNTLTAGIGSSSAGGEFAPEMRAAGISHVVVTGRSKRPGYLWIDDGKVTILDARHLKGLMVSETEKRIREEQGDDIKILSIGPAGEHLVRGACIIVDSARAAGRCGLGAIMGSKNLKAVAIRGTGRIEGFDERGMKERVDRFVEKLLTHPFNQARLKYGVYCGESWTEESPFRNFQGGVSDPEKTRRVNRDAFLKYRTGRKTCKACPLQCWGVYEFDKEGRHIVSEALQANDIHNFGAKLDLCDPEAILEIHALCNDLGLDSDNGSGALSWAFECFQRGLINEEDTGGLRLEWGDREVILTLLRMMAYRKGFGDLIAEGSQRAAQKLGRGTERYAVHVKGQDLMESIWHRKSWALGVVVSARGGGHTRGAAIESRLQSLTEESCTDLFGIPSIGPPSAYANKERVVGFFERMEAVLDSLGMCLFMNGFTGDMLTPRDCADLLSIALDKRVDASEILQYGERIHTLEKAFNVLHAGWTREDDFPPRRFMEEPISVEGEPQYLDREKWSRLLDDYYDFHGWDPATGWPTANTLDALNLQDIAERIDQQGRSLK